MFGADDASCSRRSAASRARCAMTLTCWRVRRLSADSRLARFDCW
jgi:hypothetical protein